MVKTCIPIRCEGFRHRSYNIILFLFKKSVFGANRLSATISCSVLDTHAAREQILCTLLHPAAIGFRVLCAVWRGVHLVLLYPSLPASAQGEKSEEVALGGRRVRIVVVGKHSCPKLKSSTRARACRPSENVNNNKRKKIEWNTDTSLRKGFRSPFFFLSLLFLSFIYSPPPPCRCRRLWCLSSLRISG